jgi:transposase
MELFEDIRRVRRQRDASIRELAKQFGTHRRTVRQALAAPAPPPRRPGPARDCPVTGPVRGLVRSWLVADLEAPRKQRHTARRVWDRLIDEEGVAISQRTVRKMVAELRAEVGPGPEVMVPQTHPWGAEAEVDFGEFHARVAGVATRLFLFVCRLSASGRVFCRAYANVAQEAFFDGHVRAFAHFGGVPGRCRYDNLKPAVVSVLRGRDRKEHDRFTALRSHYGFESFFCRPGKQGAHEKGGVEGEVGFFRRNGLVPVPDVASLAELNSLVEAACLREDGRRIGSRASTVGEDFAAEAPHLAPLPASGPFEAFSVESRRVDSKARVSVRGAWYSAPSRLAGRRVTVRVGAEAVEVVDPGGATVARHVRAVRKGAEVLELDHYLDALGRKPGALPSSTPLAQAKAAGTFTAAHQAWWDRARRALGDQAGAKALIDVLIGARRLPPDAVADALDAAVRAGWTSPDAVLVEARLRAEPRPAAPLLPVDQGRAQVVVGSDDRALPDLAAYDLLAQAVAA